MNDTVVIGLGNPLLSDEGIGVYLIQRLIGEVGRFDGVDFLDIGTTGIAVVHAIAGRRKAILIDCARMGREPGALHRFTPDDVRSRKTLAGLSLHEGDLLHVLDLSKALGEFPEEVIIFGIEPADTSPGELLSAPLAARMPEYVLAISTEIVGESAQ